MSVTNDSVLQALIDQAQNGTMAFFDNLTATAQTSSFLQANTICLISQINRFTQSPATGTAVLRQILTGEADTLVVVINDGANAILVYPFVGESQNGATSAFGATTASLSVPAGQSAVFFQEQGPKRGGLPTTKPLQWKSGVISA